MVFSSSIFLFIFMPAIILIYYNPIFTSRNFRNNFLLLASLVFYAWGEPIFVFLMIISIIAGWFAGLKIEQAPTPLYKKKFLIVAVGFHLSILFIFKYLTFIASEFSLLLNRDFSFIKIALPIGISFFTFQLLSYLFDVYYGKAAAQKKLLHLGLYISLFPQLIAGPIVRYETIENQILNRKETLQNFSDGMIQFIYGLGKKILIANYVAQIADNIFDSGAVEMSVATAWIGAVAYSLQIYFDFSGYSDMAIGLGKMFGFKFPENFNYPYISRSATEFWRRWHISLGTWFRDYVYIPLGGNRVSKPRHILNLFTVWALTGIWHGANWTFLTWGLIYFVLLVVEKFTGFAEKIGRLAHLYTMAMVIIAFVIFRSENITFAAHFVATMFGIGAVHFTDEIFFYYLWNGRVILFLAILLSTPIFPYLMKKLEKINLRGTVEPVIATCIFLLSLICAISATYNPFIYFNF